MIGAFDGEYFLLMSENWEKKKRSAPRQIFFYRAMKTLRGITKTLTLKP